MHIEGGGWVGGRVDTLMRGTFATRPSHCESPGVQDKQLLQPGNVSGRELGWEEAHLMLSRALLVE